MTTILTDTRRSTTEPTQQATLGFPDTAVLTVYEPGGTDVRNKWQIHINDDGTFVILG